MRIANASLFSYLLLAAALLCAGGCVERKLVITSEPSGAEVRVNNQWRGKTPYELPFKHYGTFGITIEHPGYVPVFVKEPVEAPAYQRIGPDLISEAVIPAKINDVRKLHYVLQKVEGPDDPAGIVTRAEEMIQSSDPILDRQRKADALRQPKELFLPVKEPKKTKALEEEQRKAKIAELTPPKPTEAKPLEQLEPLAPLPQQ